MGKFLVVVSFHNKLEKDIDNTFNNVLNQTHKDWVLIVGDDFSSDTNFKRILKTKVLELNDSRIIYYEVKKRRELYLLQNTFLEHDYDYFFDLDSDDSIHPELFKIYNAHFEQYPEVYSIFSDYNLIDDNTGDLLQWSLVQEPENWLEEWNFRHTGEFWEIYSKRNTQTTYGCGRAMRRPEVKSLPMLKECKTAMDTYFLFYNLSRGKHLHVPRNLYTYRRRPGSDSGVLTQEEFAEYNLNCRPFLDNFKNYGKTKIYEDLWHVTSAISTCDWLDGVTEFSLFCDELTEYQKKKIQALYPDKTILYNQEHENVIVSWTKKPTYSLPNYKRFSLLTFNDLTVKKDTAQQIQLHSEQIVASVNDWTGGVGHWYHFFRQNRLTHIKQNTKTKLVFIAPHLSTGGLPQFVLTRLQALISHQDFEIWVIEYNFYSGEYTVQRDKIINILGDRFISLGYLNSINDIERGVKLKQTLLDLNPDIIHIDECPEAFDSFNTVDRDILYWIYNLERKWRIIETCHNSWFNGNKKEVEPDAYAFCSPYHVDHNFKFNTGDKNVIEYPIIYTPISTQEKKSNQTKLGIDINKIHILNIGLWTPGKNQREGIEIARYINNKYPNKYQFHFVGNQASNFEHYWGPLMKNLPSNVKVWGERKDTELFYKAVDGFMFNSTSECSPLVLREAIGYGLKTFAKNLPQYSNMFDPYIINLSENVNQNAEIILKDFNSKKSTNSSFNSSSNTLTTFREKHVQLYNKVKTLPYRVTPTLQVHSSTEKNITYLSFEYGPKVEVIGHHKKEYFVEFIDSRNNQVIHSDTITNNMWTKCSKEYYIPWIIKINGEVAHTFDLKEKKVKISFDSKSVGDTLAWMPQVLEFKKKYKCNVAVSTFHNDWFEDLKVYKDLEFVEPDTDYPAYAHYKIGWFKTDGKWDEGNKNPIQANTVPLIQAATDILGLPYKEVNYGIDFTPKERPIKQKYICIGPRSTAGLKEWPHHYWRALTKHLIKLGYKVVSVSHEGFTGPGIINRPNMKWENTLNHLYYADLFIGLGSGLSWANWALGRHTLMINNFVPFGYDFTDNLTKVENHSVCNNCWTNKEHTFDPGDWDWCPVHRGTDKQHICHKSIKPEEVLIKVKEILNLK